MNVRGIPRPQGSENLGVEPRVSVSIDAELLEDLNWHDDDVR